MPSTVPALDSVPMTSARSTRPGVVDRLLRYPVKSMLGEEIPAADVTERGLAHDRRRALVDKETGRVASAKQPRLWHRLLTMTATAGTSAVRITTWAGEELRSTDPGVDDAQSEIVGRPVVITDTPPHEATLDRADPEDVLRRDGVGQPVGAHTGRIAVASPREPSSTSRPST
ncbi:hypothetical protein QF032_000390 [Streptomyces achromogenes]|nr:hypothetical protein [Streptomyces achromogenes]